MELYNNLRKGIYNYPDYVHEDETVLNQKGLFKVQYNNLKVNELFYKITLSEGELIDNKYIIDCITTELDLDTIKDNLLDLLSTEFEKRAERPIVETSLGFTVQGGYTDLRNFEMGKKYGLPVIKDVDNINHTIDPATDYDIIISAIEMNGINLMSVKWNIRDYIENAIDITTLKNLKENIINWIDPSI